MQHLSVCGSDLRTYDRTLPEEEYPLAVGAPCHECVGVVEESEQKMLAYMRAAGMTFPAIRFDARREARFAASAITRPT